MKLNMNKVEDGLYLFYVKNENIYAVGMSQEQWDTLQFMGNIIAGSPIKILDKPMGKAENFLKKKER